MIINTSGHVVPYSSRKIYACQITHLQKGSFMVLSIMSLSFLLAFKFYHISYVNIYKIDFQVGIHFEKIILFDRFYKIKKKHCTGF